MHAGATDLGMSEEYLKGEADRFLIDAIRAGSPDAFGRLVERYGGRLKAFAARRLQGSGLDPEDAVQETFLSLLRGLDQLAEVRSLQAYLFTILRRRIADLARARGHLGRALPIHAAGEGDSSPGFIPASPEETPSTYARRDEALALRRAVLAEALDTLLSRLKEERRFRDLKVLELIFIKGTSNQDAARLAGTSEPTASRTVKMLVGSLRSLVSAHPRADALGDLPDADLGDALLNALWAENLFTCLKRSTLGSYALGVLEAEWADYVRFHLEVVGCECCAAHLADVTAPARGLSESVKQQIFASSRGFLK